MEWNSEVKQDFEEIKRVIVDALVLVSPNYAKPFYIYSFASDHSCASMLTQNLDKGDEHPIAFMSAPLKDAKFRYPNVEKKNYALVRGVKKFNHYILRNKVFSIVPDPIVKLLLM